MALRQALAITILAAAAAAITQSVRSRPLPWQQVWSTFVEQGSLELGVPVATLDQARRVVEAGAHIIMDARPPADFAAGHLAGAFSVPSEEIEKYISAVMPLLTREQPIMTYCSGHECDESLKLSKHLLQNGFTNIVLFVGGFSDWTAAQLPVER